MDEQGNAVFLICFFLAKGNQEHGGQSTQQSGQQGNRQQLVHIPGYHAEEHKEGPRQEHTDEGREHMSQEPKNEVDGGQEPGGADDLPAGHSTADKKTADEEDHQQEAAVHQPLLERIGHKREASIGIGNTVLVERMKGQADVTRDQRGCGEVEDNPPKGAVSGFHR